MRREDSMRIETMNGWRMAPQHWRKWLKPKFSRYGDMGYELSWLGFVVWVLK